ncbi:MAG: NAD(P)H-dependent glycerol-3-phosphate dehydrogenase [Clostridia bacterium]|nr:NAD(P)H-dependent glycerol-3-phosphate dehydrogenase [Clostridia bacterium]
MKITVIGCGRWGSLITWYLSSRKGHDVTLYGRASSPHMQRFLAERRNDLLTLPDSVTLTTDLAQCLEADCETVIISVGAQGLRALMGELTPYDLEGKTFVLCMKGIEAATGKRLTEIVREYLPGSARVAVWVGPGHVQEFYAGIPNCMVIDSEDEDVKRRLVEAFSGDIIRFYYGTDLIGSEIGAAAKNVVGIAAGMLDGAGLTTLKGALMSRGTREIARLISAMGGNELSAYGLCHLGDYEATVFSKFSHNRAFGEAFIKGETFTELAEGYATVRALVLLGQTYAVDLPICTAVYRILYERADPRDVLDGLFGRTLKTEFYV